jgi:predicted transcriptional regulator
MSKEQETRITVRYPSQLINALKPIANRDERSLNWELVQAVREYVARKQKEMESKDATQNI